MKTCVFVVLILVVLSYMQKSYAQYTIDPSFGINGISSTGFGGAGEQNSDELLMICLYSLMEK